MDNLLPMFLPKQPLTPTQSLYAAFPAELKSAMKLAAKRFDWIPEDWERHVTLLSGALAGQTTTRGSITFHPITLADAISAYAAPLPEMTL